MPGTPTPRSKNQILAQILNTFRSRTRLSGSGVGGPILTLLEAAAQSDAHTLSDFLQLLVSLDLDQAQGEALVRHGRDENLEKFGATAATGKITITDTSFSRISSTISQARAPVIAGSTAIDVTNAASFPATGSIYLGRGTGNYEGPIAYTLVTDNTSYWTLTLSSPAQNYHDLGEDVVLAQGGDRTVAAGTSVRTPQRVLSAPVTFLTQTSATIPDGEVEVAGVDVRAQSPGLTGNVPALAIKEFTSPPFTGAVATNPLPFVTATATESDSDFKDRIRVARRTRVKGTLEAIQTSVLGQVSDDDNKRIASSSCIRRAGEPTTLYIDDGTGYEQTQVGVGYEVLVESAVGGEKYLELVHRPVVKAGLVSELSAPFALAESKQLAFSVAGTTTTHTFHADAFVDVAAASAYEVAASIASDSSLGWTAFVTGSGTKVRVQAKADTNEDIAVVPLAESVDANSGFGFDGAATSLRLYVNDRLLYKDGVVASVTGNDFSSWGVPGDGDTLIVDVDGTGAVPYAFTDSDFVDAGTDYTSVGVNDLESWAAVINAKIPGITCTSTGTSLQLVSNVGASDRALVSITGGDLADPGVNMFDIVSASGRSRDYILDRNLSQITLTDPLQVGDRVTASTLWPQPFVDSEPVTDTVTVPGPGTMWIGIDDVDATVIDTGINAATSISITSAATNVTKVTGFRVRVTATGKFQNVAKGDVIIIWDSAMPVATRGQWRVAARTNDWIEFDSATTVTAGPLTLAESGFVIGRCQTRLNKVTIPAADYLADDFSSAIASDLVGGVAETFQTDTVRIHTNTVGDDGSVIVLAQDADAALVGVTAGAVAVAESTTRVAAVVSGNTDYPVPSFSALQVTAITDADEVTVDVDVGDENSFLVGAQDYSDDATDPDLSRWGENRDLVSRVISSSGAFDLVLRDEARQEFLVGQRFWSGYGYGFTPRDQLVVVVDGDSTGHRYPVPLYRNGTGVGAYGQTITLADADNSDLSLAQAFGLDFPFEDCGIAMAARAKTDAADASKRLLWRSRRLGAEGEAVRVRYDYPVAASSALDFDVDNSSSPTTDVNIYLPSGAARSLPNIHATTRFGAAATNNASGTLDRLTLVTGFVTTNASRTTNVTTLTLNVTPTADVTAHGLVAGDFVYIQSTHGSFTSGVKVLTGTGAGTVSYSEIAADVPAVGAGIGNISRDVTDANFTGTVVVGDILYVTAGVNSGLRFPFRVSAIGTTYVQGLVEADVTGAPLSLTTTPSWQPQLGGASAVAAYPLASNTATAIAAAVNALDDTCLVTATVTGTGAGSIALSSWEAASAPGSWTQLADGWNWVESVMYPPNTSTNYQFTLKKAITGALTTDSDWVNESVRIVPLHMPSLTAWMNVKSVTGFSSAGAAVASGNGHKLQLSSSSQGGDSKIQVQGGFANSVSAAVVGSLADTGSGSMTVATINAAAAQGLGGGGWVRLQNNIKTPKQIFTTAHNLDSITGAGLFTFSVGDIYTEHVAATEEVWVVQRQGAFTCYSCLDTLSLAGVEEGDYVRVFDGVGGAPNLSSQNQGLFQVVRVEEGATQTSFWVENEDSVEEEGQAQVQFLDYDSLVPGDVINIGVATWGDNQGLWTVADVDYTNPLQFTVAVPDSIDPVITPGPGPLGSDSALVTVEAGSTLSLVKQIHAVVADANPDLAQVKFVTAESSSRVGEVYGTVVTALDKLAFPTATVTGGNGYEYATGLVGLANKIVYGDGSDPTTYPGVAAADDNINIQPPRIKRLSFGVQVRLRSGDPESVRVAVQNAVAGVVNSSGIGESVAISEVVAAVSNVGAVAAVVITYPEYDSDSDLVNVGVEEKALVLNLDDVSVTFVGE